MIDEIRRYGYRFIIGWLLILLLECCLAYFAGRNFDSFLIFFYCPASILVLFCVMKWFFGWLENSTKKSVDDFHSFPDLGSEATDLQEQMEKLKMI